MPSLGVKFQEIARMDWVRKEWVRTKNQSSIRSQADMRVYRNLTQTKRVLSQFGYG